MLAMFILRVYANKLILEEATKYNEFMRSKGSALGRGGSITGKHDYLTQDSKSSDFKAYIKLENPTELQHQSLTNF